MTTATDPVGQTHAHAAEPFAYRDGQLHGEGVPLTQIAEAVGTPFYLYSAGGMEQTYRRLSAALGPAGADIYYALKANSNQAVIATFARLGAGADVVSQGELHRAIAAGVPPGKIVFAGVGKTREEMAFALNAGILQFNVESFAEIEALDQVARAEGKTAPIAVRVNPDVDARSHDKISTGRKRDKFGIDLDMAMAAYERAQALPGLSPEGLAVHIGSQITEAAPFGEAFERAIAFYRQLRDRGIPVTRLDLGGGLGVDYHGRGETLSPEDYGAMIQRMTAGLEAEIAVEPGRCLVAANGVLVTRVIYIKHAGGDQAQGQPMAIVDAAMNDLIRPTLYEAWHDLLPVAEPDRGARRAPMDVYGPICESGDFIAKGRYMPPLAAGELIAISHAGAYGAVMSSIYNSRLLVPEVMVRGADYAVVRPRPDYATMLAQDRLPAWLDEPGA